MNALVTRMMNAGSRVSRREFPIWIFVIAVFGLPGAVMAASYLEDIKPVLKDRCYACHGALKQKAGLRLDTAERIRQGGNDGEVVSLEKPNESKLLERIRHADAEERMPPEGKPLETATIAAIQEWITAGAPVPENEKGDDDPREHWAFQRIERPALPATEESNPIDAFLTDKLADRSLTAQPEAERPLLLRRLYLNLIGLPPSEEQLRDPRPWAAIVDELLGSPHHGERWGRHWMDVWRYSDWYGLGDQLRHSQKHLWRWRDWIVDSLNADKGYDRMILEMLAGDEVAPGDPDVVRATGFLARNYYLFNRTTWLDSTIEHTGKAFFGLTLNCAKCHDHKYDPISHVDYYRFRAIFEPHHVRLDAVPGETDLDKDGLPRVYDDRPDAVTHLHLRGDPVSPDTATKIRPGVPEFLAGFASPIEPVPLSFEDSVPGAGKHVHENHLERAEEMLANAQKRLAETSQEEKPNAEGPSREMLTLEVAWREAELRAVESVVAADEARRNQSEAFADLARMAARRQAECEVAGGEFELLQADKDKAKQDGARDRIAAAKDRLAGMDEESATYRPLTGSRKALETPEHKFEDYPPIYPEISTGRRLALTRWAVHRENPLTARVAVNHVWARHFGAPLVESMFDFGRRAKRPEHAELLDYLAVEFMESGWHFRHLHRLIVTSKAYRRSSSNAGADVRTQQEDPGNVFYWRMNARRMEAEVVRDTLLQLAGVLDLTLGGPSIDPKEGGRRRSLYFLHSRDQKDQFLSMFDHADHLRCYRRKESIVPQQALALSNSELALDLAVEIALRLADREPVSFTDAAFKSILGRNPDDAERADCRAFAEALSRILPELEPEERESRVRTRLVQALLNHNDFITIR